MPDIWAKTRVYPATSGVPGPRDATLTPYMIPFARAMAIGEHKLDIMVCGAQMGKTESILDVMGERLDNAPANLLYVGPSKEFNTDQFEPRFEELLTQSKSLARKVAKVRQKKSLKRVAGVRVRFAHAGSSTALKSDPAAKAFVDEYDEMNANVKGQGDPLGLVVARGFTFSDFTCGVTSTPSNGVVESEVDMASGLEFWKPSPAEDIESPIWRLWQAGTMHHWAVPCPECDVFFVPRGSLLRYPDDAMPARAMRETRLECPHCKALLYDDGEPGGMKAEMNRRGRFVAPGQWIEGGEVEGEPSADVSNVSYWVSGLMSPFQSWGQRVEAIVEAEGDPKKRQTAINAGLGELFSQGGGDVPEWKELLKLRLPYAPETLPSGVRVITCGIDVMKNSIYYVVRGWGARATSWQLARGHLIGSTADFAIWDSLSELLDTRFEGRPIKVAFIDSGFRPGKPDVIPENMVYEFCRMHGRFVFPTKGYLTQRQPIIQSRIEVDAGRGTSKYGLALMRLDSDYWKRWVHERIRWPSTQAGAFHLYTADNEEKADEDYARQMVSEVRILAPGGKATWIRKSRENHFLDCEAMAAAAGYFLNVQHIKKPGSGSDGPPADEDEVDESEIHDENREAPETPPKPPKTPPPAPDETGLLSKSKTASRFAKMAARMNARK